MNSGGGWGAVRRRFALGAAVLTASGLLALAAPAPPAEAAARLPCAGRHVRTLSFSTGAVYVFKRNGYVCAVTLTKRPGVRREMTLSVQARGNRAVRRETRSVLRAGPVTVHAGRRCVWVRGSVGGGSVSSGWILC
ncbi:MULTISPECIES: hypothetical protein [unclassified Streptomyces]|uniref:hypothetical protein n=1 Tax=unclassified Streptomyces TaxID=2593676 RepID=UPI003D72D141